MLDIDIKTGGKFSKTFRMLDASNEGQREAALHHLYRMLAEQSTSFGTILDEFGARDEEIAHLRREETTWQAANDALAAENNELREFIAAMSREASVLFAIAKLGFLKLTRKRLLYALGAGLVGWSIASGSAGEAIGWGRDRYYALLKINTAEAVMRQRLAAFVEGARWQAGDGDLFLDRFKDPSSGELVYYWYALRGVTADKGEIVNGNLVKLQKRCIHGYAQRAKRRTDANVASAAEYFDTPTFRGALARITFDEILHRCVVLPADS